MSSATAPSTVTSKRDSALLSVTLASTFMPLSSHRPWPGSLGSLLGAPRQQDLRAHWRESGCQECADACRVGRRHLGPERFAGLGQVPGCRGERATEATAAPVLVDL